MANHTTFELYSILDQLDVLREKVSNLLIEEQSREDDSLSEEIVLCDIEDLIDELLLDEMFPSKY